MKEKLEKLEKEEVIDLFDEFFMNIDNLFFANKKKIDPFFLGYYIEISKNTLNKVNPNKNPK